MNVLEMAAAIGLTMLLVPGVRWAGSALGALLRNLAALLAAALLAAGVVACASDTDSYRRAFRGDMANATQAVAELAARRAGAMWARGADAYRNNNSSVRLFGS